MASPLVVGFDLDMTLIDTTPGFGAVLRALGDELGVAFPVEEMTAALGPPLELMLAPHLPAEDIPAAGDRFRALPKAGVELARATAQVGRTGSPEQVDEAVAVLDEARRRIYSILARD